MSRDCGIEEKGGEFRSKTKTQKTNGRSRGGGKKGRGEGVEMQLGPFSETRGGLWVGARRKQPQQHSLLLVQE